MVHFSCSIVKQLEKQKLQHMKKQFEELRFQPKNQILAARFTEREAREIRIFCKKHGLHLSSIIRSAFKEITSNIKK